MTTMPHDPTRTDHPAPREGEHGPWPCFVCWCYACGKPQGEPSDQDGGPNDPHANCME